MVAQAHLKTAMNRRGTALVKAANPAHLSRERRSIITGSILCYLEMLTQRAAE
jgi:hypothetical protein